jgi:hypothetical protein
MVKVYAGVQGSGFRIRGFGFGLGNYKCKVRGSEILACNASFLNPEP